MTFINYLSIFRSACLQLNNCQHDNKIKVSTSQVTMPAEKRPLFFYKLYVYRCGKASGGKRTFKIIEMNNNHHGKR